MRFSIERGCKNKQGVAIEVHDFSTFAVVVVAVVVKESN